MFINKKVVDTLIDSGFELTHASLDENCNRKLYTDGKRGMIKFEKYGAYRVQLYIHYSSDGKHRVNLYEGEDESNYEEFKVRNILSVLKRRGLIK